ncbi:MAG: type II secretion system protein GspD, partial [Planctomycetota bacterium]
PWNELLIFPDNWKELSYRRREAFEQSDQFGTDEDRQAYLSLNKPVGILDFQGAVSFGDLIEYLVDVTNAPIYVKWSALRSADVRKDSPVDLGKLPSRKLSQVLKLTLDYLGDVNPLGYTVEDGVIKVSTADDLSRNKIIRIYDIQDLIIRVPDFAGPRMDVGELVGGGESTSTDFFAEESGDDDELTRQEMIDNLIETMQESIDTYSWDSDASIRESRGQLIITQTPEVTTGFLERIGMDLNIYLNAGGAKVGTLVPVDNTDALPTGTYFRDPTTGAIDPTLGYGSVPPAFYDPRNGLGIARPNENAWSDNLSPIGILGGSKLDFATGPTGVGNDIGNVATGLPSALQIAGAFMDDIEVQFLIEATQGSETARILTAPRLTLYNGQRAYVTVSVQTTYIKGWEPLVAEGSAALRPIVDFIPTGSVLDVEATVSADRRYVTMTIRPQVAELNQRPIRQVNFVVGGGPGVGTAASIELPEVRVQDLQTTVSVPDGGTLLLGGQKLAGEVEREVGPPVLSKIPFINRFFTARGTVRDERTLLILVRPKIIIHKEYETDAFP